MAPQWPRFFIKAGFVRIPFKIIWVDSVVLLNLAIYPDYQGEIRKGNMVNIIGMQQIRFKYKRLPTPSKDATCL
ncbi:MAG: hypothetical protein IPM92_16595 [Saprospiraceae bacterium]|nr:hypothetical protein [Saprospiraceae bacterium]